MTQKELRYEKVLRDMAACGDEVPGNAYRHMAVRVLERVPQSGKERLVQKGDKHRSTAILPTPEPVSEWTRLFWEDGVDTSRDYFGYAAGAVLVEKKAADDLMAQSASV